jgi:ABC-type multidrug transport system ATPase subunit
LPDSTPAIELLNATKQYGEVTALDHVSMVIEPGEFFCLLGRRAAARRRPSTSSAASSR